MREGSRGREAIEDLQEGKVSDMRHSINPCRIEVI